MKVMVLLWRENLKAVHLFSHRRTLLDVAASRELILRRNKLEFIELNTMDVYD